MLNSMKIFWGSALFLLSKTLVEEAVGSCSFFSAECSEEVAAVNLQTWVVGTPLLLIGAVTSSGTLIYLLYITYVKDGNTPLTSQPKNAVIAHG